MAIGLPFVLTAQDNTFNGTTNSDWDTPTNWSTGKVPPISIVQKITIASNCIVPASNSTNYSFAEGSTFQINSGVTFTNNGTGTWAMGGTFDKEGSYISNLVINGTIEPGTNVPAWTCGDPLVYDGQSYATVQIGTQCWMAENLNIGTMINSNTSSDNQTDNNVIEKYCYDNDTANCATYGGFYQWNEIMQYVTAESTQGVCPTGWHLPSDTELKTMEMQLGMSQAVADASGPRGTNEGSKMAGNAALWANGNLENDSEFGTSGLAVLSVGYRHTDGSFSGVSNNANLWSSTELGVEAWYRNLHYNYTDVDRNDLNEDYGFSVRCVRD